MKQSEATEFRPFYSVGYQYTRNPYTIFSCNNFGTNPLGIGGGITAQGTDSFDLAKRTADLCVAVPYIRFAWVHKTVDRYNHNEVYRAENQSPKL